MICYTVFFSETPDRKNMVKSEQAPSICFSARFCKMEENELKGEGGRKKGMACLVQF